MPPDSIALIGFMATGKSTVGKKLAKILGEDY
ncbi:MAG: shikimate kinase, partial [Candidatus Lokiarchaeota archaeon]|nr:shikimate kinase [Candidatus Lokiarchaeota archaeon]